jgi:DNA-directed RNA polymerase specialized sigma24 family protein
VDIRTISESERRELYEKLWRTVSGMTGSDEMASEITQQAFLLAYTTRPWQPGGPKLSVHLFGIARSLVHHERLKGKRRRGGEGRFATEEEHLTEVDPSAESMSLAHAQRRDEKEQARDDVAALRARLVDPLDHRIADLMADDTTKPQELCKLTGASEYAVTLALARIRRTMKRIWAERGRAMEKDE